MTMLFVRGRGSQVAFAGRAKNRRRQDTGNLARYLSGIVENWPQTLPGPAE